MINKTNFIRSIKDPTHLYNMYSVKLLNLQTDELQIMIHLLSNADYWIVNRIVIKNILTEKGMPHNKFATAWMNLQKKGFIIRESMGRGGGFIWTIIEDPEEYKQLKNKTKTN